MSPVSPEVVVLIVCHEGRAHIGGCLRSVLASGDRIGSRRVVKHVVVVDNASSDGSADLVTAAFPEADVVRSARNLGFAGGANLGWTYARRRHPDAAFLFLLNQDAVVADGWLGPLLAWMAAHDDTATCQPLVALDPERDRINTAGIRCHYLGYGLMRDYGLPLARAGGVCEVDAVSGAALLVRASMLAGVGLFEGAFFMYLEDVELCWRLAQMGYRHVVVPESVVYHAYRPDGALRFYSAFERNRWWLMLVYYRAPTLVLLLPALLLMEAGQLLWALRHRRVKEKLAAWQALLRREGRDWVRQRRRAARRRRAVGDRRFMGRFSGRLVHPAIEWRGAARVGNALLAAYWWIARRLIRW